MTTKLAIPLLVLAGILIGGSLLFVRAIPPTATPDPIQADAWVTVRPSVAVAQVGDVLGAVVNENYWGADHPLHPDWNDRYLGRTVTRIRELTPGNGRKFGVRFGPSPTDGAWGNEGYRWVDAFDPRAWTTSIDEFMDYVEQVGGEPHIGVNFGSGTAQEAAALVAYVNGTDPSNPYVKQRMERGQVAPYNVRNWIVGFEPYAQSTTGNRGDRRFDFANPAAANGGDPEWHGKPSSDPANFAARAAQFAREMRVASPTPIEIYAPANTWDLTQWGGSEPSIKALAAGLGDSVDGLTLTFYPAGTAYGETEIDLLGRPETLAQKLDQLQRLWSQFSSSEKPVKIGDVQFNNSSRGDEQAHQLVNALFVVDTIRVLAAKGVASGFYFAISAAAGNASGHSYFAHGDVDKPMPSYLATELVSRHLGNVVVASEVSGGSVASATGGKAGAFTYPTLTVLPSLSPDRSTLYLVVVNKDLEGAQTVAIQLDGVRPADSARVTLLSGPSATAAADEVQLTELDLSLGESARSGNPIVHTFPAHSVTAFRIPLTAPVPPSS